VLGAGLRREAIGLLGARHGLSPGALAFAGAPARLCLS
jgi:hypothetical protein